MDKISPKPISQGQGETESGHGLAEVVKSKPSGQQLLDLSRGRRNNLAVTLAMTTQVEPSS
jgi:hypothetical protein